MREGQIIIFTKKPAGSYLTVNEPYKVEACGDKFTHFRNMRTGGATFDCNKLIAATAQYEAV
jgi:hypothetical protein